MTATQWLRARRLVCLFSALFLTVAGNAWGEGTRFRVTCAPEIQPEAITGRVYVMLGPADGQAPPRYGPNWFRPQPFFAVEARDWKPGEVLEIGAEAIGFPGPLDELAPGNYKAQAVVRLNPDTHEVGNGEGNAYGPVVEITIPAEGEGPQVDLSVDALVPPREFRETDRLKLVDIPSPMLTAFHGRPIRHRAALILPEAEAPASADGRYPTLYIIPGFGGSHFMAQGLARRTGYGSLGSGMIRVVLDPDCGTGHHVFADSATNGPRGQALIDELIPYIEKTYPAIAEPAARLLTGHSSGGWSSLWLQVAYPEFFGGVWSTSPDPVDFHDFQRIDLYAANANMFTDPEGNRRPLARRGTEPMIWYDDFARMEDVLGDGGQLHSFEAVFSPRGADGKPRPLWERSTGAVDPETAKAWEAYDIRMILEKNWDELGPKLAGKLHVVMGDLDTFYLEGATQRLKEALERVGSDAEVVIVPGKDHGSVLDAEVLGRIAAQMEAATATYRPAPVTTTPAEPEE